MPVYRGSWYSQLPPFGWFDREDKPGSNALGVPNAQQGIALPSRGTLGQWYNVTPPGESLPFPMQQTDVGPAKWTGRGVDISAAAAHQMGYTPQTFPTDAGWKVEPRDEPRGLGSPAGMPVQAGDLPDNATGDAYASGPQQGQKMPDNSLMDMFSGPYRDAGGNANPNLGFGDILAQRQNSLIGLGLGLMAGSRQDPFGRALTGYAQGSAADQDRYQTAQNLAERKAERAQAQKNWQQQFARSGETPFQKMTADIKKYGTPAEQFYASQLGNVPQIASIDDPNNPGDKISVLFNPRAPVGQQITRINAPGSGTTGVDPFVAATNPLAPGATVAAPSGGGGGRTAPVYGSGPGGFSATPSVGAASGAPGTAQSGQGPVEAKTMREARAKAVIANEEDAVKSARAAAEFKPALDEMTSAYEALVKSGGIGPIQGSEYGRKAQALTGIGTANESLRQRYDTAKAKVQAQITAAQNKGEGQVSNFERRMYAAQFPELSAIDPATQLPFLRQLQTTTNQTINIGRGTSLGGAPGSFERPPIEQSQQQKTTPTTSAPKPGFVKGGYVFKGGDPSDQNNWAPVK